MRAYQAFYKGRTLEVQAESSYQAQQLAAKLFKAKKAYDVSVLLCDVTHSASII